MSAHRKSARVGFDRFSVTTHHHPIRAEIGAPGNTTWAASLKPLFGFDTTAPSLPAA